MSQFLVLKSEHGSTGPLFIVEGEDKYKGTYSPYKNGEPKPGGGFFAEWFTLAQAKAIAKREGLPLEFI